MFRTMDIKEVTGVKDHGLIRLKGECSRCLDLGRYLIVLGSVS